MKRICQVRVRLAHQEFRIYRRTKTVIHESLLLTDGRTKMCCDYFGLWLGTTNIGTPKLLKGLNF